MDGCAGRENHEPIDVPQQQTPDPVEVVMSFPLSYRRPVCTAFVLAMSGCNQPEGVWMVEIDTSKTTSETCDARTTENFLNADVDDDKDKEVESGPYSIEWERTRSNTVFFVQILPMRGQQEPTLVMQDNIYPGQRQEDGSYRFAWTWS